VDKINRIFRIKAPSFSDKKVHEKIIKAVINVSITKRHLDTSDKASVKKAD
jgi:hypothetical protein